MTRPQDQDMHVLDFERPIVELEDKIQELVEYSEKVQPGGADLSAQIEAMRARLQDMTREIFSGLSPWQRVQIARHPQRPAFEDYLGAFLEDWIELAGDRMYRDDRAIATGFARIGGRRVLVVAHKKGRTTKERLACNFGMPHPEGYRKALRKMKLAEKLGLPVVTLINTAGAYPGVGAEERGQSHAIAENLLEMARLRVPVVCVILAEGGSGGALGIGVGDQILMLENAYYSVISPEGCAAILWKTAEKAQTAANILNITATDLMRLGVIDHIVPEPAGGAHRNWTAAFGLVEASITRALSEVTALPIDELLEQRYQKLRSIGAWIETTDAPEGVVPEPVSPRAVPQENHPRDADPERSDREAQATAGPAGP